MDLSGHSDVKLPSPETLRATALKFLREGNELAEAQALSQCTLEVGELRFVRGSVKEVDITLRCDRALLENLKPRRGTSGWEEEPELTTRLKEAVKVSLPSGYGVANFEAQARAAQVSAAPVTSGMKIRINGQEEKVYHISTFPTWGLVLKNRTIELRFCGETLDRRETFLQFFEAGVPSLDGLRDHPDIRERGIGPQFAAMLIGTLQSSNKETAKVFCWVRDHKSEEREIIFQARLREAAERQAASGALVAEPTGGNPPARPPDRYLLRKKVVGWSLVFDGGSSALPDWKGVACAAHLLVKAPGEWIHGAELGRRACGHAVIEGQRNLAADDAEEFEGKRKAKLEWQRILDDPDASEPEQREARAEMGKIEDWARKHLRGTEGGETKQVRAIRQSIRRMLEKLERSKDAVWRSFGEHLDKCLWKPSGRSRGGRKARVRAGLAGRFVYEPPDGVKWCE
jgi:hypothetical protein